MWKDTDKGKVKRSEEEEQYMPMDDKSGFTIFAEEQKWFKHNKYEIDTFDGRVYIRPVKDAKVEEYNPYKLYPEILTGFFSLVLDRLMKDVFAGSNDILRFALALAQKDPTSRRETHQILMDIGNILIKFYDKYGPLGIFFEDIQALKTKDDEQLLVLLKEPTFFGKNLAYWNKDLQNQDLTGLIEYEKYAKIYFPGFDKAPELFRESIFDYRLNENNYERSTDFMNNYSEEVSLILLNDLFLKLIRIIEALNEFYKVSKHETEEISAPNPLLIDQGYPGVSEPIIGNYMLTLIRDGKYFKIGWKAQSLLGILVLLFLENLVKQRAGNLTVCRLEGCTRLVQGKAQYCRDTSCESVNRQRAWNFRKKAKEAAEKLKQQQGNIQQ